MRKSTKLILYGIPATLFLSCGGGLLGFAYKSRTDRDRAVTRLAEVGLPTDPDQIKHIPDPTKDAGELLKKFEAEHTLAEKTPIGRAYVGNHKADIEVQRDFVNANPKLVQLRNQLFAKTELATQIQPDQGYEQEFPRWGAYKDAIDFAIAEASILAADGKPVEALSTLAKATNFAKVCHTDPIQFSELLGMSRVNMLNRYAASTFSRYAYRSDVRATMRRYIQKSSPSFDLRLAIANDVSCGIVLERNLNSGKVDSSNMLYGGLDYEPSLQDRLTTTLFRVKEVRDVQFDRLYSGLSELYQAIPADNSLHKQRIEAAEQWENMVNSLSGPNAHLLRLIGPQYSYALKAVAKLTAEWRTLNALLAASEIKAKTGRYPTSLPVTGQNAIDPFTDQPLKYLLKDGKLTIYSVGDDLSDNEGKLFRLNYLTTPGSSPPPLDIGFSIPFTIPPKR